MKKVLLITDNEELLNRFRRLIHEQEPAKFETYEFHYAYSSNNKPFHKKYEGAEWIKPLRVADELEFLIAEYDIILSLHCKQLFPSKLVENVRCINVHPGLNPHNRGWFPQVFSIINGMPGGATIHEIDAELDHGAVIFQKEVKIENWDTSFTAYKKVLEAEIDLLREHLTTILSGEYETTTMGEGNLNLKKDFDALCRIDPTNMDTFLNHINKLRALSHGDYLNAFFVDNNGDKIYLKLELQKEA